MSNVPFADMGTGSLCDYSLWARGSTDADFANVVQNVLARRPSDMILVSHAYLGGTKAKWWRTYEAALAARPCPMAQYLCRLLGVAGYSDGAGSTIG